MSAFLQGAPTLIPRKVDLMATKRTTEHTEDKGGMTVREAGPQGGDRVRAC